MKMFDKIKDFFKLNCVAIEHSSTQEEVDKLNQILHDMGAIPINVSGIPTIGVRFISDLENGKGTIQIRKLLNVLNALGLGLYIFNRWENE